MVTVGGPAAPSRLLLLGSLSGSGSNSPPASRPCTTRPMVGPAVAWLLAASLAGVVLFVLMLCALGLLFNWE